MVWCWGVGVTIFVAALLGACSESTELDERCAFPGPAPMCGQQCTNPCGCACNPSTGPFCSGDQVVECVQGTWGPCYQQGALCAAGACLDARGKTSAHCTTDCDEVRQTYTDVLTDAHVAVVQSGSDGLAPGPYNYSDYCSDDDCNTTTAGHCELGLGGCWYLGAPIPELDKLAGAYAALGCPANASCVCPARIVSATCESNSSGDWEVREGPWLERYAKACVVK
jgi:hypothetical protein